jgi:co-chaperonin GroES (HSP10)
MKIVPVGHRVLIKPDEVDEKIGSFYIPKERHKLEQQAQVTGVVLEVGHDAYQEYAKPWCKVGDKVLYQRHAGMRIPDGKGDFIEGLLLLNDLDITGLVMEEADGN